MNKQESHVIEGISRDMNIEQFSTKYAYDAHNIRITAINGNSSMLSVTNEKGTFDMKLTGVTGTIIGDALINNTLIVFTTECTDAVLSQKDNYVGDKIYQLTIDGQTVTSKLLFSGYLAFSVQHKIETLVVYESDAIQKVYWVDGYNQPRMILLGKASYQADEFDFARHINLSHTVKITKSNTGGEFTPGTVQWAFSYYNKFSQETRIFDFTPMYYLSPVDKGLAADGKSGASFQIRLDNLDSNFDYVRVFSIVRSEANGTPQCRIVGDYNVTGNIDDTSKARYLEIIDNGIIGETVDAKELLYVGGEEVVASTLAQKDNTLFLGNIKETTPNIGNLAIDKTTIADKVHSLASTNLKTIMIGYSPDYNTYNPSGANCYDYKPDNNRSSAYVKRFKAGENYRLGFIAQYKTGQWSEAVWINDADATLYPKLENADLSTCGFTYTIDKSIVNLLISKGFQRVAPVVVYPSLPDRRVICQGILCPTVYNVKDRMQNSPYAQADWDFGVSLGAPTMCMSLGSTNGEDAPIQCMQDYMMHYPYMLYKNGDKQEYMKSSDFVDYFAEDFMYDTNILTFHSPDIECSDELTQNDFTDCQMRVVGLSFTMMPSRFQIQNNSTTAIDWLCETSSMGASSKHAHFIKNNFYNINLPCYADTYVAVDSEKNETPHWDTVLGWVVYPWHRSGSLNNQDIETTAMVNGGYKRTAVLKNKTIASLYYARTTYEAVTNPIDATDLNKNVQGISITTPQLFNSDEMTGIRIDGGSDKWIGKALTYYGNVDKVITPNLVNMSDKTLEYENLNDSADPITERKGLNKSLGYPICYGWRRYAGTTVPTNPADCNYYVSDNYLLTATFGNTPAKVNHPNQQTWWDVKNNKWVDEDTYYYGKDVISMRYKTTPHLVVSLKSSDDNSIPCMSYQWDEASQKDNPTLWKNPPFWVKDTVTGQVNLTYPDVKINTAAHADLNGDVEADCAYLPVAELYRNFTDDQMNARFGGRTPDAFTNNNWVRCGNTSLLQQGADVSIVFTEGDTYLGRYDCLKSYPYAQGDPNSVVNIYSTEVESRVNLDERYDKNRGLQSNLTITPENFNLFNHPSYEQDSNFFNFHGLDYDKFSDLNFPNMVAWSTQKSMGEDVDSWADIDITSTFDLDGDKGGITALKAYNDSLYAFQEKGFSQLLYNSRVQIPTSDNVPIEITNGMKMEGKRYISNIIGCTNKRSIKETEAGLYFIDSESGSLYRFSDQLENISLKEGMKTWFDNNKSDTIRTFYDKTNMDAYIVDDKWSLVFSEQLGKFTSFMDYSGLESIQNIGDGVYGLRNNGNNVELWKMFDGDYNSFLGKDQSFWITFVANQNPTYDKVFNNLELRTVVYDNKENFLPNSTFDTLRVWTEYQDTGDVPISDSQTGYIHNLRRKFNVWRMPVPRDMNSQFKLDRIRNTWAYIRLSDSLQGVSAHQRFQFMDMLVDYFI